MKRNIFSTCALVGALFAGFSAVAMADITVDKTNGILSISSDIEGTVVAKVIAPNDEVVVNERFSGNSFSWAPTSGPDGAYRYDVRVSDQSRNESIDPSTTSVKSDYAGGSVEVKNGQIAMEGGQ